MVLLRRITLVVVLLAWGAMPACKREDRAYRVEPPAAIPASAIQLTTLHAGPSTAPAGPVQNDFEQSAYAIAEGKRFFEAFNCVGCHAHGAGGMGPALMDDTWIYGSNPEQIRSTIVEGRPNGMPSFRGRIPDYQVWEIVAYVRSMSGLASKGAAPGRDDHLRGKRPENSVPTQPPTSAPIPPSAEHPG